jgi:amino acid transporter
VDYTLTVAVSVSAGVGALTSAFPRLDGATVPLCLAILAVIAVLNLRGVGNAARAFLLPTLFFIVGLLAIIAVGLVHPFALHLAQPGVPLTPTADLQAVTVLLVLKAFSAGCSALTGVEAIANGVPLFRPPRQKRAKRTEMLLGSILGVMLLGLSVLASRWHIGPRSGQTVLSQIMADAVGRHWAYYIVSLSITLVLALAANTSFGGLPILASLLARDNYVPHLFALRGDRQVFDFGILTLTALSALLLIAVGGSTERLIPLFAIGVFTGFTLSQSGMVVHWWKSRPRGWQRRAAINGLGAAVTAVATVVFVLTKFTEGAWVVVVAVPSFILLFVRIHRYYDRVARLLGFKRLPQKPEGKRTQVIVPFTNISRVLERALSEALSIGQEVLAVTVIGNDEEGNREADKIERHWERWSPGVPMRILRTDYASLVGPVVSLIDELRSSTEDQIVVLIPVIVPDALRHRILHNHVDFVLTRALRARTDIVVARVPMGIDEERRSSRPSRRSRRSRPSRPSRSRLSRPRSRAGAR